MWCLSGESEEQTCLFCFLRCNQRIEVGRSLLQEGLVIGAEDRPLHPAGNPRLGVATVTVRAEEPAVGMTSMARRTLASRPCPRPVRAPGWGGRGRPGSSEQGGLAPGVGTWLAGAGTAHPASTGDAEISLGRTVSIPSMPLFAKGNSH